MSASKQLLVSVVLRAIDQLSGPVKAAAGAVEQLDAIAEQAKGLQALGDRLTSVGKQALVVSAVATAAVALPVKAYADAEAKSIDASLAWMRRTGEVSDRFEEIKTLATKLARTYYDDDEAIQQFAASLKMAGVGTSGLLAGGLEAGEQFHKLFQNVALEDLADTLGALQRSLRISSDEFGPFLDQLQRATYAFGLDAQDMQSTLKLVAPQLGELGLAGLNGSRQVFALVGALRQAGFSGRQLGGGLRSVLTVLPGLDDRIKKSAELQQMLAEKGIHLQFFDKAGHLAGGIPGFIAQLEKLNALDPAKKLDFLSQAFGPESATVIAQLASTGVGGLGAVAQKMSDVGSMSDRVALRLQGATEAGKGLKANLGDLFEAIGESVTPALGVLARSLSWVITHITDFATKHEWLVAIVMGGIAAFAVLTAILGTVALALGTLIGWMIAVRSIGPLFRISMLLMRGGLLAFRTAALGAISAVWSFTTALLANPITWIVIGIAALIAVLYVLWKHWDRVRDAAVAAWDAIKHAVSSVVDWFGGLSLTSAGMRLMRTLWEGIKAAAPLPLRLLMSVGEAATSLWSSRSPAAAGVAGAAAVRPVDPALLAARPAAGMRMQPFRGGAGASHGGLTVHYAPQVHVAADVSANTRQQLEQLLRNHADELVERLRAAGLSVDRGSFAGAH